MLDEEEVMNSIGEEAIGSDQLNFDEEPSEMPMINSSPQKKKS